MIDNIVNASDEATWMFSVEILQSVIDNALCLTLVGNAVDWNGIGVCVFTLTESSPVASTMG